MNAAPLLACLNALASSAALAARTAANTAAARTARSARALAPVRTGYLRSTIGARDNIVTVSAPYAPYVELGTRFMAARPFLRPALRACPLDRLFAEEFLRALE